MNSASDMTKRVITYSVGFVLSIVLTILAYALAINDRFRDYLSPATIAIALSALASVQLAVQLLLFLHLGNESKPRWKLVSFIFAFVILGIIVFGSLWIMFDLNSRMMMSPTDMIKYMNRQSGV